MLFYALFRRWNHLLLIKRQGIILMVELINYFLCEFYVLCLMDVCHENGPMILELTLICKDHPSLLLNLFNL